MFNKTLIMLFVGLFILTFVGYSYAHTVDSVDQYRLEIGWMVEPVVSGETNGLELYVNLLDPDLSLDEQEFKNGIPGLEKSLKVQLVYQDDKVTIPFRADHNVPGKYYALVDPTAGGYYQANILGKIQDVQVSKSMHPPKVENKTYLEFPPVTESTEIELESLRAEINDLQDTLNRIESSNQNAGLSYLAIGLGISGIAIGAIAVSKKSKQLS